MKTMKIRNNKSYMKIAAGTVLVLAAILNPTTVSYAQFSTTITTPQTTTTPTQQPAAGQTYVNEEQGYRVQVPNGWFVNDAADYGENGDEYLSEEAQELQQMGGLMVDQFCPQETGEMDIGGEQDCNLEKPGLSPDTITVVTTKYNFDLPHMYEFANVINTGADVTTNDLLIWELDRAKGPPSLAGTQMQNTDVKVVNQTDRTADLVDSDGTVDAPGAVQVKEAQYTYRGLVDEANGLQTPDQIVTLLLAVYNDPESDDVDAYALQVGAPNANVQTSPPGQMLQRPEVRQIFDSFAVLE